jgi:hypothetical protein
LYESAPVKRAQRKRFQDGKTGSFKNQNRNCMETTETKPLDLIFLLALVPFRDKEAEADRFRRAPAGDPSLPLSRA